MTLKERYKRFKAWQLDPFDWSYDENERHHCVNCGNDFAGKFCPHCAQKAGLKKVSWKSVLQSTAEVWGMGNRSLLYSLWQLIWRPGYFISDYINGKRQVSFPPVKMLVLMGVVSVLMDHLFGIKEFKAVPGDTSLVDQFFTWFWSSPGWGLLIMAGFFLIPTWCLFSYAPCNTRHTLPQGFFITVFMAIQTLIVECLADFFGYYTYILVPLCYFYTYRQLFGYGFWGNFWRVAVTLVSGFWSVIMAMTIVDVLMASSTKYGVSDFVFLTLHTVVLILVGMFISKKTYELREKKKQSVFQYLKVSFQALKQRIKQRKEQNNHEE